MPVQRRFAAFLAVSLIGLIALTGAASPPRPVAEAGGAPCDDDAYQLRADGLDLPSTFYDYDIHANVATPIKTFTQTVNAIGYSEEQKLFYGFSRLNNGAPYADKWGRIVTITTAGVIKDLGGVRNLAALGLPKYELNGIFLGTVAGDRYYAGASLPGSVGTADVLYEIDIDPASPTYLNLLSTKQLNPKPYVGDWDFNPVDRKLYGVSLSDPVKPAVVSVDPATGTVTTVATPAGLTHGPKGTIYGGAFVTTDGTLYAINNNDGTKSQTFRIPLSHPDVATPLATGEEIYHDDGADCLTALDWGDAPDSYGTSKARNGPRHSITAPSDPGVTFQLGRLVDSELNGHPSAGADGDDLSLPDDEDALPPGPLVLDATRDASVSLPVVNSAAVTGELAGWIDFNGDGTFGHDERAVTPVTAATSSTATLTWPGKRRPEKLGSSTFARFRLFQGAQADPSPLGQANGGEVEDYPVAWTVGQPPPGSPPPPGEQPPVVTPPVPAVVPPAVVKPVGGPGALALTSGVRVFPLLWVALIALVVGGLTLGLRKVID